MACQFTIEVFKGTGIDGGIPLCRIECKSCNALLHASTGELALHVNAHLRDTERLAASSQPAK